MMLRRIVAAVLFSALAGQAFAAAFFGFIVANVPEGDVLNARSGPSTAHAVQTAYPNGVNLSLTGTCTGGVKLDDLGGLSQAQKYAQIKSSWCEIWHDPGGSGNFVTGWVYGRYIYPH
jgi:uncharacterized protein YraI